MAIKDILKVNRKTFFNPREWLGYDFIKQQFFWLVDIFKVVFGREKPQTTETFEEAQKRFNLSDTEIEAIGKNYFLYALLFAGVALIVLILGIYLLTIGSFAGFLLSLALMIFLGGQAFRNHFWYFQIKHRKLGCTFEEWREGKINTTPIPPKDNKGAP